MNKFLKWFLIMGVIVTIFDLGYMLLDIPRTKQVNQTYPVVAYHYYNEEFSEQTSVRIKGALSKRISGNHFSGTIEFYDDTKEEMQEYDMWLVKITNANYLSGWIESSTSMNNGETEYIGTISLTTDFKRITIWFNSELNIFMSGPASTREEAVKIDKHFH